MMRRVRDHREAVISLHPTPVDAAPPDTTAMARAVSLQGDPCGSAAGSLPSLPTSSSPGCFPRPDSGPVAHGAWLSRRCCSSRKTCRTDGPPTPFAAGSTRNTCLASPCPMRASTPPCCASSVVGL